VSKRRLPPLFMTTAPPCWGLGLMTSEDTCRPRQLG